MITTAFLLVALAALFCLCAAISLALFLFGWLKKRRTLKRIGAFLLISSFLLLVGELSYVSMRVLTKLKGSSPRQCWQALVNAAFDDTGVQPADPAKARQILKAKLGNAAFLQSAAVQGVWVDSLFISYGYFLYVADEKELLNAIASAPVDSSYQLKSDDACQAASWDECRGSLMFELGPQRNLPDWKPEAVAEKRCYRCLRCPWSHTILLDGKTGKVYHYISEIRE